MFSTPVAICDFLYSCPAQVINETSVQEVVACGPIRQLGAEEDSWAGFGITAAASEGDAVTIVAEDEALRLDVVPEDSATLLDANGEAPPSDLEIEAPPAPKADAGEIMDAVVPGSELEAPLVIATPDAQYQFTALGAADHVGEGATRVDAPEGGSFVTIAVSRVASSSAPNGHTSTLQLMVDGTETEIPEDGGTIALAFPADAVTLDVEYEGNVQQVSPRQQKLVAGHPYTLASLEPVNAPQPVLIGDGADGVSTSYQFDAEAVVSSWSEKQSWAPEGKDRLGLVIGFDESSEYHEKSTYTSLDYDEDVTYTVTSLTVTADGTEIPVDPASATVAPRADDDYSAREQQIEIITEVPIGVKEVTVSATVHRDGTLEKSEYTSYERETAQNEPASIEEDLTLEEVTLTGETF